MVSKPYNHYDENRETYNRIADRLDGIRESYLSAGAHARLRALFDSTTYALLTARAPLEQADRAFDIYVSHYPNLDVDYLSTEFQENGIGFYNNKAKYIGSNAELCDEVFLRADRALTRGHEYQAQSIMMNATGIGPAKSGFLLATLGFVQHACADTHVCQLLDLDPREYENHSAEEYKQFIDDAFDKVPRLKDELGPFMLQWICFDTHRGGVETHD